MTRLEPAQMAERLAQDIPDGSYVNLGIGMPVMVKASAGGGGRGMRRVEREDDLADAIAEWGETLDKLTQSALASGSEGDAYNATSLCGAPVGAITKRMIHHHFSKILHL